jgi:hypothetical protein
MDTALSICVGIGLSAACGFRVFVPLLILSIASLSGHAALASHFQWIGTYPALTAFAVATALEICGYYIPWVDHMLDTMATPASVIAGIIITGSMLTKVDPFLHWSLAVIAGGGIAGAVQTGTVLARAASTATTGGFGNPIVATAELGLAIFMSILAVLIPVAAALLVVVILFVAIRKLVKRSRRSSETQVSVA